MDDMEEVTQRFAADVEDYLAEIEAAAEEARGFARANEEARAATESLRDKALEAAAAMGIYRDEAGRWRDSSGRFAAAAELEALGLGHVRDNALEAAAAVREVKKEEDSASRAGLLARFFGGGGGGGLGSGMFSLPALLAIIPAIEALLPEVVGLVSGFAAAGAGAGAFALLAVPAIKSVSSAYQGLSAAQQKYQAAVALENLDPTKAHARAVKAALDQLTLQKQALEKLPPAERQAVSGISQLTSEFGKLSKAFAPEAFKVFTGVLKVANDLLPTVTPFATTFADSVSGLLGKLSGFVAPPGVKETFAQLAGPHGESVNAFQQGAFRQANGFQQWLAQFRQLEGPSITAIGNGIGKVAVAIGGLLTVMSKKDVVNAINIAFGILAGTITIITGMIKRLMDNWDGMSVAAKHTWYDIKRWTDDVTQAFDKVRHFAATMAHDTAVWFDFVRHHAADLAHNIAAHFGEMRHDIAQWAGDVRHDTDLVIGWFEKLPGRIVHGLGDLGHLLWNAGAAMLHGFLGGIESGWHDVTGFISGIAGWISGHKGPIEADAVLLRPHGIALMRGLISGLRVGMGETMSYVTGIARDLSHQVGAALADGLISSSQARQFMNSITERLAADQAKIAKAAAKLSLDFNAALTRSLEDASSASAAKSAVAKLAGYVKQAWTAGLIGTGEDRTITNWLDRQSQRLQALAAHRQQIVKEIAQARQFAAQTASNIAGNFSLSGFATSGLNGGAATVGQVISGLRLDVGAIRKWAHNIHKLAKEGLNRNYLGQLIGLGPVQGAALVQELANAGLGDIKAINSAEYQISEASGQVGKLAANAMYDSGAAAGKGFLSGLLAQKKAITELVDSIARSMIATLKRELKLISAPPQGGSGGYALAGSGGYGGSSHATVNITANFAPGMDAYNDPRFLQYIQRVVQEATLRYGALNPGNGLTPKWGH